MNNDKKRIDSLRGGSTSLLVSLFKKPMPGSMEFFLKREEIAQLSDQELLALDNKITSEALEDQRIMPEMVRKWADEITGGELQERLQAKTEQQQEMEDDGWLDTHLGNRDR